MTNGLTARILEVHRDLDGAALPHAFGGALALAFCTAEPRGTKDIDVNVFVGVDQLDAVLRALPDEIAASDEARGQLERDGQARLWWGDTPLDVFLSNHPFHDQVAANVRVVPFAGVDLPVLSCPDLAVFKAFFARPKDAVDVANMITSDAVHVDHLETTVRALLGDERDSFLERVRENVAALS